MEMIHSAKIQKEMINNIILVRKARKNQRGRFSSYNAVE